MSAAWFAPGKPTFRIRGEGRGMRPQEDFETTRDDAQFFRAQTLAIVRHFFEIACQIGRLPSILGRELFRSRVSHHAIPSFEDQVVFVHDVERALARLEPQDEDVLAWWGFINTRWTRRRRCWDAAAVPSYGVSPTRSIAWRKSSSHRVCCGRTALTGACGVSIRRKRHP